MTPEQQRRIERFMATHGQHLPDDERREWAMDVVLNEGFGNGPWCEACSDFHRPDQEHSSGDQYCDHCQQPVHRDLNRWWVGADETSECPTSDRGHEVAGQPR